MVDAKELRIGNWVQHTTQWSYRNDGIRPFYFQWEERDWYAVGESTMDLNEAICPISITPDILIATGFHKHNNAWVTADYDEKNYMKDYFTVWNIHDGEYKLNTTQFAIEITSLHQLQNLYFALTGEELTYTPPLIDLSNAKVGVAFFDENGMISRVIVQPTQTIDSVSNTVQNTEE